MQLGQARNICVWQFGDVVVDPGPTSCLETVLKGLDGVEPQALLLTHIHLDHAGAAGTLARKFPNLHVYVHERGAKHMLDPEKLIASATRIYGEHMDLLWGAFEAVPQDRLHVLTGGETLKFDGVGSFDVVYTPGHAVHHVSYLHDSGVAFVGDVAGVRPVQGGPVVPPTPPPDIDPEQWQASIQKVRELKAKRLAFTHWGANDAVDAHLDELSDRLTRWAELARDGDSDAWTRQTKAELDKLITPQDEPLYAGYTAAANFAGLRRYWDRRTLSK